MNSTDYTLPLSKELMMFLMKKGVLQEFLDNCVDGIISVNTTIGTAFIWENTKQGHDFWEKLDKEKWVEVKDTELNSELLEFCMWLTGHDKETIEQMYDDWKRWPGITSALDKNSTDI